MVVEDFAEPQVKLDYFGGTSGSYAGFDRFGRVVDQKWYDYGAGAVRDQYTYGHDRASNRLYRENTTTSGKDEYYTYDGVNRLVGFDRGDLNAGKTAISGTPAREQDWTLDPTGNWADFVQKTAGSTDLNQSRTHNAVNELTDITETQGTAWLTPAHDKAGNMTVVPKPSDLANGLGCTYDAWNRLVQVADSLQSSSSSSSSGETAVVVAVYEYDGGGRRIVKHVDSQSPGTPDGIDTYGHHFYLGAQLIEARETGTETAEPEALQPQYQYVWSPRYIDAPILRDENTDADGLCDDDRLYYLTDANFNVTVLVDTAGDAVERYLYDPYGKITIYTGDWSSTRLLSAYSNACLYTGRELDTETGSYYYRTRCYHVGLGRFVGRDPIGYWGGMSLYDYCRNGPTIYVDPSGLAQVPSASQRALSGIATEECDDVCGPDVTSWFLADLEDVYTRAKNVLDNSTKITWGDHWYHTVKYDLSYKWMAFAAGRCGTGRCKNTVMLAGICIRKNQLGNIAYGFFQQAFPPMRSALQPAASGFLNPIPYAYSLGREYNRKHPHAANYGVYAGVQRADNLAAFAVGYALVGPAGTEPWFMKSDAGQFSLMLSLYMNAGGVLSKYAKFYGPNAAFTPNTLTFAPEYGGFNTRSCQPCKDSQGKPVIFNGPTSQKAFETIQKQYDAVQGAKPSLDEWLQQTYEDYLK